MSTLANGTWLKVDRVRRVATIFAIGSTALLIWLAATSQGTLDWRGRPLGTDFSDVWTAGKMALAGHAIDPWNWTKHFAVQRTVHGPQLTELYAWHYPPPFLLVASALALLPYVPALIIWQLATLIPFALMMQRLEPGRDALLLTLAAPVTVICASQGQNGFLTAFLIGNGLMLLDRRPITAGAMFGCAIYKPQFCLLLPVCLLAGRHWRALLGACISAGILIGMTLWLWGWPVWHAFLESLPMTRSIIIEQGATGFYKIMSPFAAARMWGGSIEVSYAVQLVFTAAVVVIVFVISLPSANAKLRNTIVCAGAVVATPYVLDYDLVILLPALVWLYRDGEKNGFLPWDATIMAAVWSAPLFARPAAKLAYVPLGAIAALAVGALALRRMLGRHSLPVRNVHSSRKQEVGQP